MNAGKNYAQPQPLNEVMIGGTVGEVVESKHPKFSVGQTVQCMGGWQEYSVINASLPGALKPVNTEKIAISHYLGAVGMPGVTAWHGLVRIIEPKAGQTLTVSAASGAVGSAFGALAKARGCRVIGIAGGKDKCDYVTNELGFDACIDYKLHSDYLSLSKALKEVCPDGIDGHFENVGGMVLDAVMLRMNHFSSIAVCGMISGYNGNPIPMANPSLILVNRMKVQGFIVSEHPADWPVALKELGGLVGSGKFKPRETVAQGLANAPEAFFGLLKGKNFGKQVVKI
jgi:NADPH-dependent curcumin reductase CurA